MDTFQGLGFRPLNRPKILASRASSTIRPNSCESEAHFSLQGHRGVGLVIKCNFVIEVVPCHPGTFSTGGELCRAA